MPHSPGSPSNSGFAYLYSTQTPGLLSFRRIHKRKSIASGLLNVQRRQGSQSKGGITEEGASLYLTRIDPNTEICEGFFLSFFFEGIVTYYSQMSWTPSVGFSNGQKHLDFRIRKNLEIQQVSSTLHLVYVFSNTQMLYKYIERRCSPQKPLK